MPQNQDAWIAPLDSIKYKTNTASCMCPLYFPEYIADQEQRLSGVVGFIESKGSQRIDGIGKAQKGDFIQFWYPSSWGHCGVIDSVDTVNQSFTLHSSFPSTNGYGV